MNRPRYLADDITLHHAHEAVERMDGHPSPVSVVQVAMQAAINGAMARFMYASTWRKGSEIDWSAVKGRYLDWKTAKSRGARRIMVPVLPELRALLDGWERASPLILVNSHGGAWTDDAAGNAWQRAKDAAGIDKRFHDFRGTFATYLIQHQVSDERVAGIVGWFTKRIAEIRERYVSADAIMADVLAQMDRASAVNPTVNRKPGTEK